MFGKTKRTFGIGLRAVALAVGLATLLGGAHQAVAGGWVPFGGNGVGQFQVNDGYTVLGNSAGSGTNVTGVIQSWSHDFDGDGSMGDSVTINPQNWYQVADDRFPRPITAQIHMSGSVSRTFKWIPNAGKNLSTDPPPNILRVLVHSYVSVYGTGAYTGTASLSFAVVDNGFRGWPGNVTTSNANNETSGGQFWVSVPNTPLAQTLTTPAFTSGLSATLSGQGSGWLTATSAMAITLN